MKDKQTVPSSFRDPSGFLFLRDGELYRQINHSYSQTYDHLMHSGLYKELSESNLLIPHKEVELGCGVTHDAYAIIKPEIVPFLSYPYEWCFSQLKAAAMLTLQVQKKALKHNMTLKDASAYNIQFVSGVPILIDSLSFVEYTEGMPWLPYRQFCQHFLAPLALMSYKDVRLNQLLRIYIDGVPLDLASSLLPRRSWLSFSILSHIHLHSKSQQRYARKHPIQRDAKMSRGSLLGLIDSLEAGVRAMTCMSRSSEWSNYYEDTNYSQDSFAQKKKVVEDFLTIARPNTVWDLGANTGVFSRIASQRGILTISFDNDPAAVEQNYIQTVADRDRHLIPLLLDLSNPSPGIGWNNEERSAFINRGPADVIMALALIHHLAISNNVPLSRIAEFFRRLGRYLIVEFVPKKDSKVMILLASREDIFPDYTIDSFEAVFSQYYLLHRRVQLEGSDRMLYLMEARDDVSLS